MAKEVAERTDAAGWIEATRDFAQDVRVELRKVTWPQRKEAVAGTIGVVVVVAVITALLGVVDMLLAQAVSWVLP
jgi:preprotein translocase subunit SecE